MVYPYPEYYIPVIGCCSVLTCITCFFCYEYRYNIFDTCKDSTYSCIYSCYCITCHQNNLYNKLFSITPSPDVNHQNHELTHR